MLVPRTLIFLTRGDEVLLLKGAAGKRLWAGMYNGIGGHVEAGEDILSAARRELKEETGIVPADLWLCGMVSVDTQTNPGVCIFVFRGEYPGGNMADSSEGSLEWVKAGEVEKLPKVQDLEALLTRVLGMKAIDKPFSAHSRYNSAGEMEVSFAR